ncbi:hypothetical protein F8388_007306 [Cannabis sativa]|uniref:Uncharacterized protein n=1 Tax=Cannabis sativa TaxID=3483 RepID=A0A7J6FHP1_CANSA|nr:hypothetical protein F8388_007306 [Cannabis sativa]
MNAPIIDPLQGDFPEVIEEYLEHGVMKCIAFNRRGTLLAGNIRIFSYFPYLWKQLGYFLIVLLSNFSVFVNVSNINEISLSNRVKHKWNSKLGFHAHSSSNNCGPKLSNSTSNYSFKNRFYSEEIKKKLDVTKIIFEQLVNDDKLNPVIKFMNKAQREEANVLLAILTKNMLSTISECLLLTSARITSRFMETSTPLFSMFLQSQIISITEANQIKGPSIFAAFRMSPKFLLLQTIGVTLPLAFLFFEWASRSRGRPETIEEPNNFAASLSPFSELGFVTDGIFWLPFVPFPCTPPLLVLDVLTVPFVPPISPLCLSFPSTVVVLLPESPGAISGSKSRRLIGISTSRINFGLLVSKQL